LNAEDIEGINKEDYIETYEKMSKSKGNGVIPEDIANNFGVDTLRLALMFGAPVESDLIFKEEFINSIKSYIDKIEKIGEKISKAIEVKKIETYSELIEKQKTKIGPYLELFVDYEKCIKVERKFHVAIARLMEITNML
jgi:leucyl-tRNA synthetase